MSSKPLPSVSSRVDASSVQSQFATITQSRDALRLELQQLETEIRRTQNSMATLKETSLENSQKLTVLHESLGKHRMKKQLFQQEQSRLEQLLLQERQQLQQITDSIKQLEHDSKQNKQHFASQLQLLSNDMQDLIQKHEDAKWCAYLEHGEDAVQILHKFASTEEHASMLANIPIDWLTSIQTLQSHCNLQQDMMVELEALREQAKALEPDMDFAALEETWMHHVSSPTAVTDSVQLFYGDTDNDVDNTFMEDMDIAARTNDD